MQHAWKFKKITPIIVGVLLTLFTTWLTVTTFAPAKHWVTRLDNIFYDMQVRTTLHKAQPHPDDPVAIVNIDEKSLDEQGRWPWSRAKIAELITNLYQAGALVVAVDMAFPEPENNPVELITRNLPPTAFKTELQNLLSRFDYDQQLADAFKRGETVTGIILQHDKNNTEAQNLPGLFLLNTPEDQRVHILTMGSIESNIPVLQQAAKSTGFINTIPDEDGVLRSSPIVLRIGNVVYPSLALAAARLYLLNEHASLVISSYGDKQKLDGLKLDNFVIPTDGEGRVLIPFRGPAHSFQYISASDVLNHKVPQNLLQNKLIFLGTAAAGLGDVHATSAASTFPGIEMHANIAHSIIKQNFPSQPEWVTGAQLVLIIFFGLLFSTLFPFLGPKTLGLISLSSVFGLGAFSFWLWYMHAFVIPVTLPISLVLALASVNMSFGYLFEAGRRQQLKSIFGQYVPSQHIEEMIKTPGDFGLQGEDKELTVLFADIRNFTTLSEKMTAGELKKMLDEFLTPMTRIIFESGGTIDKYIGDLIMAFWGAPLPDPIHAEHAVSAALRMQNALKDLNKAFAAKNIPTLHIGVGVNTGDMSVGDMGSFYRRAYTVLGDTVNLGSRLEGLSKFYGVDIIVGENTYKQTSKKFIYRQLDRVKVKGKSLAVEIYEPLARQGDAPDALLEELKIYHAALNDYFSQNWDKAHQLLVQLSEKHPEDCLYPFYIKRIAELRNLSLSANWDGVYVSQTK